MKAFFNRFNRATKDKLTDASPKDADGTRLYSKEKLQLPPLPDWPPQQQQQQRPDDPPSPYPDFGSVNTSPDRPPLSDVAEEDPSDANVSTRTSAAKPPDPDSTGRSSRKATNGSVNTSGGNSDIQKKVAFISPPPTPSGLNATLPSVAESTAATKTPVSRFQGTHGKDARGSTSSAASASRTDVGSTSKASMSTAKGGPTSTRSATSPFPQKSAGDGASIHPSVRSNTPFSQRSGAASTTNVAPAASWSEATEEDLVSNLGPRERTRQEVLFEIVCSEERYVAELLKMKDTFLVPLLHPYSTSPVASPGLMDYEDFPRFGSPVESLDHLPIASRFLSPLGFRSDTPPVAAAADNASRKDDKDAPTMDAESINSEDEDDDQMGKDYPGSRRPTATSLAAKLNHPRSPYGSPSKSAGKNPIVPFPSRSHHSLPPPPRINPTASTQSLGRQSFVGPSPNAAERDRERKSTATPASRVLRKTKKSQTKADNNNITANGGISPNQIPDDLRQCLETIERSILDGHLKLSEGLRKRYDEQYPLVRSLADVFVANSNILRGYADYVLHLERALEQVDDCMNTVSSKKPKKQDADEWTKVCAFFQRLELDAGEKGETGLAISLSKPFQRLLKYPLLFQNLLFHTDPSTFEYESTLQMVAEVETIVRSIEDEKIQKEERDKTRDVFARIEGLDKVKQLAVPKPSRVLVEERMYVASPGEMVATKSSPPPVSNGTANGKNVKGKTSLKRLSDALQPGSSGVGGKKDLWLVIFNDVVLKCQRTGTTSLPLGGAYNSRANSMPELQGKPKYASTGRRNSHTRPRNMYKFLKIENWTIDVAQPRQGAVTMEEVARSRSHIHTSIQPRIIPMPEDDEDGGVESDDSDRKSKMSFSYWGADKVTLQKPVMKAKPPVGSGTRRPGSSTPSGYNRESSANAKFGTRLVSNEIPSGGGHGVSRPASRRTGATGTPSSRRGVASDEGHTVRVTTTTTTTTATTKPAWNSTRATATPTPMAKRTRNISQGSAATRATTTSNKMLASPAPSEDSGVGLYRQMMAQDPSLNAV